MSLGNILQEVVQNESAHRLGGGLALRYSPFGERSGILSMSRVGDKPSEVEIGVVMRYMGNFLDPHHATLNEGIEHKGDHFISRITIEWTEVEEKGDG